MALGLCCAAIVAETACEDVLGFERSTRIVACLSDRDCSSGLHCANGACAAPHDGTAPQDAAPDSPGDAAPDASGDVVPDAPQEAPGDAAPDSPCGDTTSDPMNCGACGSVCAGNHDKWICVHSTCVAVGCESNWGDCNADAGDGCETDLLSDIDNCFYCGNACAPSGLCEQGQCLASVPIGNQGSPDDSLPVLLVDDDHLDAGEYLFGVEIGIAHPGWVVSLGIMTLYSGPKGRLALYSEVPGTPEPDALVVTTDEFAVNGESTSSSAGEQATEISVAPTFVDTGSYWLIGQFDRTTTLQDVRNVTCDGGDRSSSSSCVPWYWIRVPYGPMPSTAPQSLPQVYMPIPPMWGWIAQQNLEVSQ